MNTSSDLHNEALRKIGRNVVFVQKLEGALKTLIVASNMSGDPSEFAKIYRRRVKEVGRRPMGWLVDDFISAIYSDADPAPREADDPSKVWVSFSFNLEADEETIRARKTALSRIVAERNTLIHKMLWKFDASSTESCKDLILLLDEQHERLKPYCAWVMQTVDRLGAAQREIAAALESGLLWSEEEGGDATW